MAQMDAVFAELERALIGQRTAEALAELRSQGRVYGPTPFGWEVREGRLVPNKAEQAVIEHMAELRRDGLGYASAAERLNDAGLRPKRAPAWSGVEVTGRFALSTLPAG